MRTWIFQGNPEVFDIEGYLAASSGLITWTVARYADQISADDSVYIWQSRGQNAAQAGILAEGTITEYPRVQKDDALSANFWKQAPEQDEALRVKIRLNRIASKKEVLKREWMKDDSVLKNMLIMRQAAGTNFPVEEQEATRLGQLWRKTSIIASIIGLAVSLIETYELDRLHSPPIYAFIFISRFSRHWSLQRRTMGLQKCPVFFLTSPGEPTILSTFFPYRRRLGR